MPNVSANQIQQSVVCPVCGQSICFKPNRLYKLSAAAEHFVPQARDQDLHDKMKDKIHELWGQDESYFLICDHCGFGFGYPYVGGDEGFYDLMHASAGYPEWRWDYDVAREHIAKKADGTSLKVLDIGAGSGLFVRKLDKAHQPFATEGGETTRNMLREAGVEVLYDADLHKAAFQGFFDVITMFQVLEHLSDFRTILGTIHNALNVGGDVIITVPHRDAMIDQEEHTACLDMPPNHINKWTPDSLGLALEQAGFEVVKTQREPTTWSLSNIRDLIQMTIAAASRRGQFPAKQVYAIANRRQRILGMGMISGLYLLKILPHLPTLLKGRSFAIIGRKK